MVPANRVIWEILPATLVYLGSPELQRLAMTCTYMHALIGSQLHHLYRIDAFFRRFFGCAAEFRFLQACTGLLVSGSQALQFMARTTFGVSDIDLYCPARTAFVVIDWLIQRGFILLSSRSPFRSANISIPQMLRYARVLGNSYFLGHGYSLFQFISPCGSIKVDLIVAPRSAFSAICGFHSTAVMNFISAYCAVSLFARATFIYHLSMVVRLGRKKRMDDVIRKYASRGFRRPSLPSELAAFPSGPRWLRDSRACWVLPLPAVPSGPFHFWTSRRYDLSLFQSDKFRQGMTYWYRMGFTLLRSGRNGNVAFAEFGYDGLHEYCAPPEFARCQAVQNSARIFKIIQQDTDLVIDALISMHL